MESIGNRLRSFGLRDLVVLLTCLLGAYLLRVRDKYRLHPAWRMESDFSHLSNNQFSRNWEKLPNPKITDIESDGHNEIVIATHTNLPRLKILKLPDLDNSSSKILPFILEQSSVSLISKDDQNLDYKRPVLIEVGFLEPYKSVVQIRKQVVVVLLADTTVLCFDYKLRLLWKKQLNTYLDYTKYYVKEAAILISSHELSPDDGGLVVVGYSLGDRHHFQQTARHSQEKPSKPLDNIFDKTPDERMEELVVENLDHFTLFGLAGKDGKEGLHHRPGDFEALPEETDIFKAHHFKLGLRKGLAHLKEQHWSHYSQSLIQALPHRWKFGYDSAIELARFKKDAENYDGDNDAGTALPSLFGLDDLHLAGYAFGGMRPHSPSEHVKNPNVIVTHSNEGIGVMNLVRRWPLTSLKLPHHGAVYVDFNQDGSVDEVKAHFTSDPSNSDNCLAVVHSIDNPSTGVIFNASICQPPTFIDMLSVSGSFLKFHSSNLKEDKKLSVLPLVVKKVAKKRSVLSHLRSIGFRSPNQGYDAVFLLSNGKMTSYGPHGHLNWQVDAPIQWNNQAKIFGRGRNHNPEVLDVYHNAFQPSMQAFSLQVFGKQDAAVVAGWDSIAVISLVDGTLLADHSLPCQPTSAVVIGDFDNDGLNDAIVQCTSGYFGFQMKRQTGFWYTVALSMLLVLIVAGFTALCSFDDYYYDDEDKEAEE
ncbi:uncharacterized protein LOC117123065 [Anneissia japonica]|uniref:uncharacterized protein LOC117123065 n=1 Tax=Anneissia japonica TaxID=1529436 RepID=UPI00142556AE|nr:uncharacterized protein LOC117123065 [Anneissia japonica]